MANLQRLEKMNAGYCKLSPKNPHQKPWLLFLRYGGGRIKGQEGSLDPRTGRKKVYGQPVEV
ncbi:unnamed protein product [Prunus armeniaca]|uniref:Uncharacterized protein n=1 Tax=Prunus armeniaca TaxID=36596 RepID=A0A6J5UVV4_PRUAR|nr:unnamed protein product [Prunus armeniaca]